MTQSKQNARQWFQASSNNRGRGDISSATSLGCIQICAMTFLSHACWIIIIILPDSLIVCKYMYSHESIQIKIRVYFLVESTSHMRTQSKFILCALYLTMVAVSGMKLCVEKAQVEQKKPPYQIEQIQQLRSYKPHLLNSFSYPKPVSALIYYGEVIENRPLLFFRDHEKSQKKAEEIFFVNQQAQTPYNAESFILRKQTVNINRFMFVVQVQNMYIDKEVNSTIFLFQEQNYYLVIVEYENQFKAYQLSFIYASQQLWKINQLENLGLKIFIRNQSASDNRHTWMLAEQLHWQGSSNVQFTKDNNSFSGIVMEMEFRDAQKQEKTQIHLKEIKRKHNLQTKEELIKRLEETSQNAQLPQVKYPPKQTCADAAISKLLGGLTYQYGTLQLKNGSDILQNQPKQLLSFSPSRTRFPWGFLWDDGFHCEVAVRKNQDLVLKVIKSWLDTISDDGWIPRQQNRGKQRQHLCNCPRFMAKDIKDGNPPTLILSLQYLERKKKLNPKNFPIQYWEKVKMWYHWFVNTLQTQQMLFKWEDSIHNEGASFTSGMDDFPRPIHSKGHVDLQSWIYFFSRFMSEAASSYGQSNAPYLQNLQKLKQQFRQFLDPTDHVLKDFDEDNHFSKHVGYPSILPIAFGILQESSEAFAGTMKMIKQRLDTGYGISSIAQDDSLYLENENAYWRGPVWINMNFLLLRGLNIFYESQKQFYHKLRSDLMSTVCGNFQKTGYFYQNYQKGRGTFSYPFNGWTSLISIIVNQNY